MSAVSAEKQQPKKGAALPANLSKTWEERNEGRSEQRGDDMSSTWDGASTQWDQQSDTQSGTWDVEQMEKRHEGNPQWNNEGAKKVGRLQDIKIDRLDKNSDTAELSEDEEQKGGNWPFPSPCVMFGDKTNPSKEDAGVFSQFEDLTFNATSWETGGFSDSEGEESVRSSRDGEADNVTSKDRRKKKKGRKYDRSQSMDDPNWDDNNDSEMDIAETPGRTPRHDLAMKYSMVTPSLATAQDQIKRPPTLKKGMRALPKPKAVSTPSAVKGLNWNHAFSPGDLDAANASDLIDVEGDADLDNDDLLPAQPIEQLSSDSSQSAPAPRGVKQNSEDTWRHKQLGDFRKRNKPKMMQSTPNISDEERAEQDDRDLLPKDALQADGKANKLPGRSKTFAVGKVGMAQSAHSSMMTARKTLNRRKKEPLSLDAKTKRSKSVTTRLTKEKKTEAPPEEEVAGGTEDVKREVPRAKSLLTGLNVKKSGPDDNQKLLSAAKILGSGKSGTTDPQEEADLLIKRPRKPKRSNSTGTKEDAREKAKRRSQLHHNRSFRQERDSQPNAEGERRSDGEAPVMKAKSERVRRANGSSTDPLSMSSRSMSSRSNRSSNNRRSSRANDGVAGSEHGGVRRTKSLRSDLKDSYHQQQHESGGEAAPMQRGKITTADLMKASKEGLESLGGEIRYPPPSEEEYKKAFARRSSRRRLKSEEADRNGRRPGLTEDRPRTVGRSASFVKRQENARDIRDLLKEGKKVTETDLLEKSNRRMLHSMIFEQKMGVNMSKLLKQVNKKAADAP